MHAPNYPLPSTMAGTGEVHSYFPTPGLALKTSTWEETPAMFRERLEGLGCHDKQKLQVIYD